VGYGPEGPGAPVYGGSGNRSVEYDSVGDDYVRFLLEELLPRVEEDFTITTDPGLRAIFGISSSAAAAFTAAWERPDSFRKVLSAVGSFVDIRGADRYPKLIRRTAPKPLRVFLQAGTNDLDILFGSWPIANQDLAAALDYSGYDYRIEIGEGGHSSAHMASILPEALRWLWRD
jgi:enterochelin esterase family protein